MVPMYLVLFFVALIPLYITLVPSVLLYEIAVVYFDEKFGNPSRARNFVEWVKLLFIGIPWHLLGLSGSFGRHLQSLVRRVRRLAWTAFFFIAWRPLFGAVVPAVFRKINSGVYNTFPVLGRDTIRLLEIQPGSVTDDLLLRMKHVVLDDDATSYEALSYSWGPSMVLRRVVRANGRMFLVTDSAYRALKELRETNRTRTLWIDSICINQTNDTEKSEQVELMHRIYTRAARVIVWLGSAPQELDQALSKLHDGSLSMQGTHRLAIQSILRRRWWSRVWIVQEVALARDVVFRIGHIEVTWATLSNSLQTTKSSFGSFGGVDNRVLDFIHTVMDIQTEGYGLLELAIRFRKRVTTVSVDKIFGLRALARASTQGEFIKTDYSMSTTRVFASFAAMHAMASQSLAPIVFSESRPISGCSWAADWQDMTDKYWSTSDPFETGAEPSKKHDCVPLWSGGLLPSVDAHVRYHAAGSLSESCSEGSSGALLLRELRRPIRAIEWTPDQGANGWRFLHLTGWVADSISITGSVAITHTESKTSFMKIIASWRTFVDIHWEDMSKSKDSVFETTVFASTAPDWNAAGFACEEFFQKVGKNSFLPTDDPFFPDDELETCQQIFTLLVACCFGRRIFFSVGGRLGLAPARSRPGDLVCMLAGSPVPFVLRRRKGALAEQYEYIDQAFLHGAMQYHSDLLEDLKSGLVKLEKFTVC